MSGGELITQPVTFAGKRLLLNFASSAAGSLRVELQKPDNKPLPGFTLEDCDEVFGDAIDRTVTWKGKTDVSSLSDQTVCIRFVLHDADLFAFQFRD